MKIIDSHAHIFPPKIADKAVKSISDFYNSQPMSHQGTSEHLLAAGGRAGAQHYFVFSTATVPAQVTSINDFIIEQCALHPEFFGVGTLHIDFPDREAELWRIREGGLRGVKLHTDFQRFNLDDERMMPVYAQMADMGMFLLAHMGDPRTDFSHPARLRSIALRYPKLRCVGAHFGGWGVWAEARELLNLPNVWVDTSSTFHYGGEAHARESMKVFDQKRILFGTDFPMGDHRAELDSILSLGLSQAALEDVLYNNAFELYHHRP